MTDRIVLEGVRALGHHGVLADERRDGQVFVVDVVLELDLAHAGRSDDLAATVDYADVAGAVVARVAGPPVDLIERLAELIADDVLEHERVDAVEVVVHKPDAPVGHPFADVRVHVRRASSPRAVVALGANLGDRRATLEAAVAALRTLPGFTVTAVSPLVETDPVGGPGQPPYLNAVLLGRTTIPAAHLLQELHRIEAMHGRTREVRWQARTLDLDLVQYGTPGTATEVQGSAPKLTLPHPRAAERAFVLAPWQAVDPKARLRVAPGEGGIRPVTQLLEGLDRSGVRPGPTWGAS